MGRRNRNSFLLSPEWILMLKWWIYLNHVCFQMKWHQWDPRNRGSTFKTVVDFLTESPAVRGKCPGRCWQRPQAAPPVPQPWVFGLQENPLTWAPWPRPPCVSSEHSQGPRLTHMHILLPPHRIPALVLTHPPPWFLPGLTRYQDVLPQENLRTVSHQISFSFEGAGPTLSG